MSTIGCAEVVSVNASCSRCYSLTQSSLFPLVFHMFLYSCMSHCLSSFSIYSVARYLYLYALPLAIHPLTSLKSLPQLQPELQLKVVIIYLLIFFLTSFFHIHKSLFESFICYSILFLYIPLIPKANIVTFDFFSIQLRASVIYFLWHPSIISFLLDLCYDTFTES